MIERDYIMRLLRQLFDALNEIVHNRKEESAEVVLHQVNELYGQYFGREPQFFYDSTTESIIHLLEGSNSHTDALVKIEMLAELVYTDAILRPESPLRRDLLVKALGLFEHVEKNSSTFSLSRRDKIQNAMNQLS